MRCIVDKIDKLSSLGGGVTVGDGGGQEQIPFATVDVYRRLKGRPYERNYPVIQLFIISPFICCNRISYKLIKICKSLN